MRTLAAVALAAALLFVLSDRPTPAVAQERAGGVKWEYAELSSRGTPGRPAIKDKDGNEQPAVAATLTLRWTTGSDDLTLKGWDEMAEKLKVELKKESSAASQKIQVLNGLGAAGWELVDQQATAPAGPTGFGQPSGGGDGRGGVSRVTTTTMLFKRRAQ